MKKKEKGKRQINKDDGQRFKKEDGRKIRMRKEEIQEARGIKKEGS